MDTVGKVFSLLTTRTEPTTLRHVEASDYTHNKKRFTKSRGALAKQFWTKSLRRRRIDAVVFRWCGLRAA